MANFNDLASELREKILILTLQRKYPSQATGAVINDCYHRQGVEDSGVNIELGKCTLRALRLASRQVYDDSINASRAWLDNELVDLFEEMEAIQARKFKHTYQCVSDFECPWQHRCWYISTYDLSTIRKFQQRLGKIEEVTRRGIWSKVKTEKGRYGRLDRHIKFIDEALARSDDGLEAQASPRPTYISRRQKELTICIEGIFVGPDEAYNPDIDGTGWNNIRSWKEKGMLPGPWLDLWYRPNAMLPSP